MDLNEYMWRNKIKLKDMVDRTGICQATLSHLKNRKTVPRLTTSIKLYEISRGEISFAEMLPVEKVEELREWSAKTK